MINGVRVRDSGVELSPTGTDRRGGPRTASNRTVRASSAIAAGSTRWLMRRTKRPLSATPEDRATHGHLWPPLYSQVAHCYANAIERLHEEFKRRIKTQTVLPSAE